jgi:hypothetical protein
MPYCNQGRRTDRRFPASGWQGGLELEPRVLLSAGLRLAEVHGPVHTSHRASHQRVSHAGATPAQPPRPTPAAEINAQYNAFAADFRTVEQSYVEAINSQSSNTVSVTSTLTAPYLVSSASLQVADGSVFGPDGTFTKPVTAFAVINNIPVATFILTGRAGNTLVLNPNQLPTVSLNSGVTLVANVPTTAQSSAAAIFPSFIINRTAQMAITLVEYFNSLPLKLPKFNAPPHTPNQRGAIQTYVYQQVAGSSPTGLQQSLLSITLPTTAGSDLTIYDAAAAAAIEQSRQLTLNGVNQVFAGNLRISAPAPANRLGVNLHSSSGSTSGTTTGA